MCGSPTFDTELWLSVTLPTVTNALRFSLLDYNATGNTKVREREETEGAAGRR